jgi:hypothetical protein
MSPAAPNDSTPGLETDASGTAVADPLARPNSRPRGRTGYRAFLHLLRRAHLYTGLFLLPWVILYGVTAFLFNHPTAFSDQPVISFSKADLAGTPMESPPTAVDLANQVIAGLHERNANASYVLIEPHKARFARDFAFATVTADGQEISVLINANGEGGTIRVRQVPPKKPAEERAPFAIAGQANGPAPGPKAAPEPKADKSSSGASSRAGARVPDSLRLDQPLHERVKAAVPILLERKGLPPGEVRVNAVPDLTFLMQADEKAWKVTYNFQTGAVSGRSTEAEAEPLSVRRFLLRLHLAHGYPDELDTRWWWALSVDAMGFIMVFWGLSGILMWWHIKATRRLGAVLFLLSAVAAVWIGVAMHDQFTALANR